MVTVLAGKAQDFLPGKHIKCGNNMKYCPMYLHFKKKKKGKKGEEDGIVRHFSNMIFVLKHSILLLENEPQFQQG